MNRCIGQVGDVRTLHAALAPFPGRYAILRSRVLLGAAQVESVVGFDELPELRAEILALGDIRQGNPEVEQLMPRFGLRMTELVDCATFAGKPILFRTA